MMLRRSQFLSFILTLQSTHHIPPTLAFLSRTSNVAEAGIFQRRVTTNSIKEACNGQSSTDNNAMSTETQQLFGRFKISSDQIFHKTSHSFALVNLRPLVPGHVLICSTRVTPLLSDLEEDEYDDLWRTVRVVQRALKQQYNCDAFNVAVQDGTGAGQSVPHVHVHILPRYRGDLERNDDIYDKLESWAPRDEMSKEKPKLDVPEDSERRDRTVEEMAEESAIYRSLIDDELSK